MTRDIGPIRKRANQTVDEMAEQLVKSSSNNKLNRAPSYPEISAEIKAQMLDGVIDQTNALMNHVAHNGRVKLDDLEAVKETAERYTEACKRAHVIPGMSGFAAALGYSRRYIYRYIDMGKTESARYMDALRTGWAAVLEQMTLSRMCSEPTGIFLMKNAGTGMTDRVDIMAGPVKDIDEGEISVEDIIARYE